MTRTPAASTPGHSFRNQVRLRAIATLSTLAFLSSCVNKELLPTSVNASARSVRLQLTTVASAQQAAGAQWIFLAAAYVNADGFEILSHVYAPVAQGSQQLSMPVDLGPCLAVSAALGKDGCALYIAAALLSDTLALGDSTRNVLGEAFDSAVPIGPFEVSQGRVPTIPPIDLSLTRFATTNWVADEGLRLGGQDAPADGILSPIFGEISPITGVTDASGNATLFVLTSGFLFSNSDDPSQFTAPRQQLAIFENGKWRRVTAPALSSVQGSNQFADVSAFASNDVYIVSTNGMFRYDGTSIARVTSMADALISVATTTVSGTKFIIAGGPSGAVVIGNGTTWQRYTLPVSVPVNGVCITGASEAFASSTTGALYRFDGTSWTAQTTPQTSGRMDLQCTTPGQAYVVNVGGPAFRFSGGAWTQVPTTGFSPGRQIHIAAASPTEIYAYGDSASVDRAFFRFDGTSWKSLDRSRYTFIGSRPWTPSTGGAAYVFSMFGRIERFAASGMSVLAYQPSMRDVAVNSPSSAFVVGHQSYLARFSGTQWTVDAPPVGTQANRLLNGVWSDGPTNAWTVGTLSTVMRYTGSAWTLVSDSLRPIASRDNYNGVWGAGANVWAVGDNSILHCTSSTQCVNEPAGSGVLLGVWGASATNVFAVGDGGRIVRYNGSTWSAMSSPTSRALARISGSSATDVWALGDSVLLHYDGAQWRNIEMNLGLEDVRAHIPTPAERIFARPLSLGLWARGPREVYLSGESGVIARFDGYGWIIISEGRYRHRVMAIHGVTANGGCALAVTEGQYIATGATLWRGVGPTGCFASPTIAPSRWP